MSTWLAVTTMAAICASLTARAESAATGSISAVTMKSVVARRMFDSLGREKRSAHAQHGFHAGMQRAVVFERSAFGRPEDPRAIRREVARVKASGLGGDV